MSKTSYNNEFFGVDRSVVAEAIRRGRRERSQALWAILRGIFGRPAVRQPSDTLASHQAGKPVHC